MSHSGEAWERGRQNAYVRDDGRCQDCGSLEYTHAHHIKRPEEFEVYEDGHHESNLVVLCKYCHPKWEGIEGRPILLDNHGTNLDPVVESLVVDHIERISHRVAARRLEGYLIVSDENICDVCHRPNGEYSTRQSEHWRDCIKMTVRVGFGKYDKPKMPVLRDGLGRPIENPNINWLCEHCNGIRRPWMTQKANFFKKVSLRISEALSVKGVDHDTWILKNTAMDIKRDPDTTKDENEMIRRAIAAAVKAGECGDEYKFPQWLREERY